MNFYDLPEKKLTLTRVPKKNEKRQFEFCFLLKGCKLVGFKILQN